MLLGLWRSLRRPSQLSGQFLRVSTASRAILPLGNRSIILVIPSPSGGGDRACGMIS